MSKSLAAFYRNKSSKDGFSSWCKECARDHRNGKKNHRPADDSCRCKGCVMRINSVLGLKYCGHCDTTKSIDDFSNRAPYCRPCSAAIQRETLRNRTPEERAQSNLARRLSRYNLSVSEFSEMFDRQLGLCSVCSREITKAGSQVDHDHSCCPGKDSCGKCVRSLLCANCNTALGFIKDDLNTAIELANYLVRFKNILQAPI